MSGLHAPTDRSDTAGGVDVLAAGAFATIQDRGRPGFSHLGVGRSGACDREAAALANRLVGNDESAAVLELTMGGLAVRFDRHAWIAITGADCAVEVAGAVRSTHTQLFVTDGAVVRIGQPERGMRTYLAVRGGIGIAPVLGSRATDVFTGIGPPVLRAGMRLPVGTEISGPLPAADVVPGPAIGRTATLDIRPGPRLDWFAPQSLGILAASAYVVAPESNRIAVRLTGAAPLRVVDGELPSEGLVAGAVQCPPSGELVLFLADHPVTGGYPVVAVVAERALSTAAQLRPGDTVRFQLVRSGGR
jgi:biotin-dependent carboxylase-like uncharacterized protein